MTKTATTTKMDGYVGSAHGGKTMSISLPRSLYGSHYEMRVNKKTREVTLKRCAAGDGVRGHVSTGDRLMLQFGANWHGMRSELKRAAKQDVVFSVHGKGETITFKLAKFEKRAKGRRVAAKPRLKRLMREPSALEDRSTIKPLLIVTGQRSQIDALEQFVKNSVGLTVVRTVVEV